MKDGVRPGTGRPFPLGASWDGQGTNFAVASEDAAAVRLSLFGDDGESVERSFLVRERTDGVWHIYLDGVGPGERYGYRFDGPYRPDDGLRFNSAKLVLDPYALEIAGAVNWSGPVHGYLRGPAPDDSVADPHDSAQFVPKCVVIDTAFDWGDDRPPATPWTETVIYETHVKGTTARKPDLPEALRGTYGGLAHPSVIDHLRRLGVTAIELLPVHAFVDDHFLDRRGLRNYWGYSTLGFFAPEQRYGAHAAPGATVREFKEMVRAFHAAGIEVFLDVVYNHTCEGNHLGPTLSLRGVDNRTYYRLLPDSPRYYEDTTGTGNTLDLSHPVTLRLVMDSLRYWVEEMRVDGFRFDLATALGRDPFDFDPSASFFDAVFQDPVLRRVKLIAEPWDLGHGGYQVGRYPVGWAEWNDKFRDVIRAFWLGGSLDLAQLPKRLSGSGDLYQHNGRGAAASVNLVTAHDGFTLADLVSYERKHNAANGEENRDGSDHNLSANHGVEGPTDDPRVLELRARQQRNLIATLFLARGVPMLLGGDELGRSQRGNNNAYCQDNEISWFDWTTADHGDRFTAFVAECARIRSRHRALRVVETRRGRLESDGVALFDVHGVRLFSGQLDQLAERAFMVRLDARDDPSASVDPDHDSSLLLLLNASDEELQFVMPTVDGAGAWEWRVEIETAETGLVGSSLRVGDSVALPPKTLLACALVAAGVHRQAETVRL